MTLQKRVLPLLLEPSMPKRNPHSAMRQGDSSSSFSSACAVAASFGLARAAASSSACARAQG